MLAAVGLWRLAPWMPDRTGILQKFFVAGLFQCPGMWSSPIVTIQRSFLVYPWTFPVKLTDWPVTALKSASVRSGTSPGSIAGWTATVRVPAGSAKILFGFVGASLMGA